MRKSSFICDFAIILLTALMLQGAALPSFASGHIWISGGMGQHPENRNPWFLPSEPVYYCILIDEEQFGVSKEAADRFIRQAFDFWKQQLKKAQRHSSSPLGWDVKLGSQPFIKKACSEDIDLRFQLGVLSAEQARRLETVEYRYGVAVRTGYDRKKLRGQGFIYLPPSVGPLKPKHTELSSSFWADLGHRFLELTLIHEMGHVYGLAHDSGLFVMLPEFADPVAPVADSKRKRLQSQIFEKSTAWFKSSSHFVYETLHFPVFSFCGGRESIFSFFRVWAHVFRYGDGDDCQSFSLEGEVFRVLTKGADEKDYRSLGEAVLRRLDPPQKEKPAIRLWVSPEREVLTEIEGSGPQLLDLVFVQEKTELNGEFYFADGSAPLYITLEVDPLGRPVIGAIVDGVYSRDLRESTSIQLLIMPGFKAP